jgi:hypothetical protein
MNSQLKASDVLITERGRDEKKQALLPTGVTGAGWYLHSKNAMHQLTKMALTIGHSFNCREGR